MTNILVVPIMLRYVYYLFSYLPTISSSDYARAPTAKTIVREVAELARPRCESVREMAELAKPRCGLESHKTFVHETHAAQSMKLSRS